MTALLISLQLAALAALVFIARRRDVSPLLWVSLFFTFVLWYVIPVVTTLVAPERLATRTIVSLDRFVSFAAVETAVFLLTLLVFLLAGRRFRSIADGGLARLAVRRHVLTLAVVAGAAASAVVRWKMISITGAAYADVNAFTVMGQGSAAASTVLTLVFVDGMLQACAAACAVTPMPGRPFLRIVIWSWLIGEALATVAIGGRLALLTPAAVLLMALHERRPSRRVLVATYASLAAFAMTAAALLTIVIADLRGREAITLSAVSQESKQIVQERALLSDRLWEVFDHLNIKFDSISAGAFLVDRYGSGVAGMKPYEGALLAVVPRRLYASKPVPGSADGTARGIPSLLVAYGLGYDADTGNVGVSPAAIAIWQFGFLGVIPLVVLNYLNLRLINSFLLRRSLITRTLGLFLIGVPSFLGVFGSGEFLVMNGERILMLYAVAALALVLFESLRAAPPRLAERTGALP